MQTDSLCSLHDALMNLWHNGRLGATSPRRRLHNNATRLACSDQNSCALVTCSGSRSGGGDVVTVEYASPPQASHLPPRLRHRGRRPHHHHHHHHHHHTCTSTPSSSPSSPRRFSLRLFVPVSILPAAFPPSPPPTSAGMVVSPLSWRVQVVSPEAWLTVVAAGCGWPAHVVFRWSSYNWASGQS
ncbi:hypothetical protein E2C01_040033 [Portunus trituberculatus]|uniref:Uncharacterized protein n=1 Tax=Portunus trituberculatus TaxID=210409 RepID=A0A5B7FLD4_PORTR|nr:hypothetical protein [Portunus trituberculatus]